jgi:RimJ/RimL family protein N-acetyltransferase
MIQSPRLNLFSATSDLTRCDISGRRSLAEALGVNVPESWPPDLYGPRAMQFALEQLGEAAGQGWSFWYLATREEPGELVGVCGFKGLPDVSGCVEIGYSIVDSLATFKSIHRRACEKWLSADRCGFRGRCHSFCNKAQQFELAVVFRCY